MTPELEKKMLRKLIWRMGVPNWVKQELYAQAIANLGLEATTLPPTPRSSEGGDSSK